MKVFSTKTITKWVVVSFYKPLFYCNTYWYLITPDKGMVYLTLKNQKIYGLKNWLQSSLKFFVLNSRVRSVSNLFLSIVIIISYSLMHLSFSIEHKDFLWVLSPLTTSNVRHTLKKSSFILNKTRNFLRLITPPRKSKSLNDTCSILINLRCTDFTSLHETT